MVTYCLFLPKIPSFLLMQPAFSLFCIMHKVLTRGVTRPNRFSQISFLFFLKLTACLCVVRCGYFPCWTRRPHWVLEMVLLWGGVKMSKVTTTVSLRFLEAVSISQPNPNELSCGKVLVKLHHQLGLGGFPRDSQPPPKSWPFDLYV